MQVARGVLFLEKFVHVQLANKMVLFVLRRPLQHGP